MIPNRIDGWFPRRCLTFDTSYRLIEQIAFSTLDLCTAATSSYFILVTASILSSILPSVHLCALKSQLFFFLTAASIFACCQAICSSLVLGKASIICSPSLVYSLNFNAWSTVSILTQSAYSHYTFLLIVAFSKCVAFSLPSFLTSMIA